MKIDNKDTYFDDRVAVDLRKLLQEGEKQAETFWNDSLVKKFQLMPKLKRIISLSHVEMRIRK